MEQGDLATFVRPHYIVVLEGVLAVVSPVEMERSFLRRSRVSYNLHWLDVPLRRLATNKRRFPEVGAEIVTFISAEVAEMAAAFLDSIPLDYDSLRYQPFNEFRQLLPFKDGLQAIYDSDPERLDRYGQIGKAILKGEDW